MNPGRDVLNKVLEVSPAFPPSFDDNPYSFAWALFGRSLVLFLAAATLVRLYSRNRVEGLPHNSPTYYHRTMVCCLLWALCCGCWGDVTTWVFWGEVSDEWMSVILSTARLTDGFTVVPFILAMTIPYWVPVIARTPKGGPYRLVPGMGDARTTWAKLAVPLSLVFWCAAGAIGVTAGKAAAWYAAGAGH